MPILISRKQNIVRSYTFELNPIETQKFEDEILSNFWDATKIPEDERAEFKVTYTIDFYKKPVEEEPQPQDGSHIILGLPSI
jgi:hypothetical protein